MREHVELGYATTAFRAQGATVDTAHAIVTGPGMTREVLYVMLTRAREANTAYVCTDRAVEPLPGFEEQPSTDRSVLTAVMGNVGAAVSAHETADLEREQVTSIRTLAAEYETIAHHAHAPRWTCMLTRAGLTPTQLGAVMDSRAFGALSTALRRAEAQGLNLEAALPRLIEHADAGTVDLASVLHQRIERWADMSGGGNSRSPEGFILGLLPAATAEHPEMAAALQDRVQLMEQRADELIDRARTANAPWFAQLGPVSTDPQNAAAWQARARTVVAYRERHQITDPWSALGSLDQGNVQQRREATIAAGALSELKLSTATAPTRSAPASPADPTHANAIGR